MDKLLILIENKDKKLLRVLMQEMLNGLTDYKK